MESCNLSLSAVPKCFRRISIFAVCVCLLGRVGAQDRRDEVRALSDFMSGSTDFKFNGANTDQGVDYWSTWNENDENPCSWAGVVCSTNFTVVELIFSGWSWGPASLQPLAGLRDLRALDFSYSYLFNIPEDIGNLSSLVRLDMSRNDLGLIPASISSCTSLQYISLEQSSLSGEIPSLRGLVNLEFLNLADNNLTGPFPKDIVDVSSLVNIDFTGNMLNGSIPSLSKLTNLLVLRLNDNNFAKFDDYWLPPPNLSILDVSGNRLGGMIPPSISNMSYLQILNMSRNRFSSVPFGFSQLVDDPESPVFRLFFELDLSQNQLFGDILHRILPDSSNPAVALEINLSRNSLTGNIPLDGAKTQGYTLLDLSYNRLTGPIPYFFNNNETVIRGLYLQHNNLSGDIVDVLNAHSEAVNKIWELRLQNNLFSGDLSRLAFANCSETSFLLVDLSNNNLQMSTMETNLHPLRDIMECFMQAGSEEYGPQYGSMNQLRMAGNNFSGAVLPTYFNLAEPAAQNLGILDLSNNHLKGEISGTAFNSTWFPYLQELDLSDNDLHGPVPDNVVNLPFLSIFSVANNSLQGPLPTILPSSTLYNPSFFAGNGGLCGDPLPPCNSGTRVPW